MRVQPGTRLGHYEILTVIGKGGMGEVWKARDSVLRRHVAVKTLPGDLARDPERLARLEREAELLATLNHPNVAAIHGLEAHGGTRFLVLELVEGDTLDERIRRGAIPVDDALSLALQIAQGLEAAHQQSVIHRDLKPANIKITPDGRIKVLDFGLGKALAPLSDSPTVQAVNPTETGVVMGTPAYMSPEQARGEATGVQADIWSFGAVLYEMLTARSPFGRQTLAETLASVLDAHPDYSALPANTPPLARRLIERCLAKDPKRRLQHMGDVRIDLEDALATLGSGSTPIDGAAAEKTTSRRAAWIVGGVVAAMLAGTGIWFLGRQSAAESSSSTLHVSIPFQGRPSSFPFGIRHLAISPDGSSVVFLSSNRLWVRRMDQKDAVAIAPGRASNPFFSPDGEWLGFFPAYGLAKVPVGGGAAVPIAARIDRPVGAAWRSDDTIVFATPEGLYSVSANGGEPKLLVKPDRGRQELLYAWPHFLPGGQSLLFTIVTEDAGGGPHVARLDLKTLEQRKVLQGSSAQYVPSGHLVYVSGSMLHAVPFDAGTGATLGKPVSFPEIELATAVDTGAANFAISETGTLLFTAPLPPTLRALEWIDRQGQRETLAVESQTYGNLRVSSDGTRVALERTTRGNRDIWILDLNRLTQTQLTDGPTEDMMPVWSVDGRRVFFASRRTGNFDVYSQAADGATSARVEFAGPEFQTPAAMTPDGSRVLVIDRYQDIGILNLGQPDRLEPLLHGEFAELLAQVSPDGRWVAYESKESGGQFEIILRSFPNVNERREKISVNGGRFPLWGPKGSNELYYVALDGTMMAASIRLSPTLTLGAVVKLFVWDKPPEGPSGMRFGVAPDGRFLMTKVTAQNTDGPTNVSVILNWTAHLQRQVPR